ncbi:hypothetical protein [Variovorax sp. GB1P17]|uniref:hypothetical protein n=1 Tax=Variovorax sp. GB1P17 TaxID=3443740 RepID=UPI003F484A98
MPLQTLKRALLGNDRTLFDTLREAHWPTICAQMCAEAPAGKLSELLHSRWIEYGGRIRTHTADDALLARALRAWLPKYADPGMKLFRGESVERHQRGRLGLCWTPIREQAEKFGRGLNAFYPGGGCLLSCEVPGAAIIAAPNAHSRWLGEEEYVVDPGMLEEVTVAEMYRRLG